MDFFSVRGLGRFVARSVKNSGITTDATAGAKTYTAAELAKGLVERDPAGANRTDVLPSAASMISTFGLTDNGDYFDIVLVNTADMAETITLGGSPTGVTYVNAGQTIAQNESAIVRVRRTSATAVSVYIIGA